MPFEDSVRPYQLPTSAPAQLYLSQYSLITQQPVLITPGFGGGGGGGLPPIITGNASYSFNQTYYCPQGAAEQGGTATEG
jgi:hypothetical protein